MKVKVKVAVVDQELTAVAVGARIQAADGVRAGCADIDAVPGAVGLRSRGRRIANAGGSGVCTSEGSVRGEGGGGNGMQYKNKGKRTASAFKPA